MKTVALALVVIVAALHCYIAWFEMFAWTTVAPTVFTTLPAELFPQTIELGRNQGLYNAFLAAGLIWSLLIRDPKWQHNVATCFMLFVLIAGIVVAITVELKPGLYQMLPSAAGLLALVLSRPRRPV